jgi:hypothetical protein
LLQAWDAKTVAGITAAGFDTERMRRQFAAANAWGACKLGEMVSGDGKGEGVVKLLCERGNLLAEVAFDDANKLKTVELVPARDQRCVP